MPCRATSERTRFAFVVHKTAINYRLLCVSQSPTQPVKLSGHVIALDRGTSLLAASWPRPKGRGCQLRGWALLQCDSPILFLKSPPDRARPWSLRGQRSALGVTRVSGLLPFCRYRGLPSAAKRWARHPTAGWRENYCYCCCCCCCCYLFNPKHRTSEV